YITCLQFLKLYGKTTADTQSGNGRRLHCKDGSVLICCELLTHASDNFGNPFFTLVPFFQLNKESGGIRFERTIQNIDSCNGCNTRYLRIFLTDSIRYPVD